ncbi:MAG: phosphate/phosphite/phosphonate ABC transporter substrate-binding protein [Chloroflexota bacterium]|nr:phosphate/phosphite/phosphonate ABC transporter substrate-binding protein [Chloroflexota bacterium]
MKKLVLLVFALLLVLGTIAACAPAPTPVPTAAPPTAPPPPTKAPTAVPPTTAPTVAAAGPTAVPPTPPPAACTKLPNMPTVAAGQLGSADKPIVITFVPSGDVPTITKSGEETAACLKQITGLTYQINVQTSYAGAIEAMGGGKAQFSFLATVSAILARQKYGVDPVLISSRAYQTVDLDPDKGLKGTQQTFYKSQFITKKGSGITKIADLKGKTFCFVEPLSASGTAFPQVVLAANGIDPDNSTTGLKAYTMAGSHPNVVAAVYKGDCDAGATFLDARTDATIQKTYPDVMDKVDVFYVIDVKIPNDGMQVAKGVDPVIRDATVAGFLAMMADPGGKAVVKRAYTYDALIQVPVTYYDTMVETVKKSGIDLSKFLPPPK